MNYVRFLEWLGCGKYVTIYQGEGGGAIQISRDNIFPMKNTKALPAGKEINSCLRSIGPVDFA